MTTNSAPAPLTPSELSALVELEKKATPGPWNNNRDPRGPSCSIRAASDVEAHAHRPLMQTNHGNSRDQVAFSWSYEAQRTVRLANAALIVALRNAAPRLFSELLALREENERLRAALADTDHTARCKFRQHFDDAPCSCGKSVIERARALASFDAAALRMSDPGAFVPAPPAQEAPAG